MKIHASGEDYLEAVLILQKKQGMVRSIDLARHIAFCLCIAWIIRSGRRILIGTGSQRKHK